MVLRPHLLPVVAVAVAIYGRRGLRAGYLPLVAGALLTLVLLSGVLDTVTLGSPFQSI